ncbi:membrane dipeptidase [Sorangium sp. So ce119]|uniref:dipeptidase n=1 Tax=Sorangium sp. So ce119 TaxID=3133279 RepID=UPI003F5FF9E8
MRTLYPLALLTAVALAACAPVPAPPAMYPFSEPADAAPAPAAAPDGAAGSSGALETPEQRAARLRAAAVLVDGHDRIPPLILGGPRDLVSPGREATPADLARMKAAGITGELFPIHVGALPVQRQALHGGAARRALDLIDATYRQVERHGEELVLATSARDLRRAKRQGRVAALMGIEGGHALENSLPALRSFYRLGVRYMTLTHTSTNDWADSAGGALDPPAARHRGLSPFGEEVVREMQRIGMLVDVSHASAATFRSVLEVASAPIIASSSVRGAAHHRRQLDDDALRALARNGGIAVVNAWALFLDEAYAEQAARLQQKHGARAGPWRSGSPHVAMSRVVHGIARRPRPVLPPAGASGVFAVAIPRLSASRRRRYEERALRPALRACSREVASVSRRWRCCSPSRRSARMAATFLGSWSSGAGTWSAGPSRRSRSSVSSRKAPARRCAARAAPRNWKRQGDEAARSALPSHVFIAASWLAPPRIAAKIASR